MKNQTVFIGVILATFLAFSTISSAKDGIQNADVERSKTMTQERIRVQDQSKDHDALRTKERVTKRLHDGSDIYGSEMMSDTEITQYRERLRTVTSKKERMKLMSQHRVNMQDRAKEQGVELAGEE